MNRRLVILLNGISALTSVAAIVLWIASYQSVLFIIWTAGRELNQITSYNGTTYLVQNHKYWRREKLAIVIDPGASDSDLVTWPGSRIESHTEFLGFEKAQGKWISPFILVTAKTPFTAPGLNIKPGTRFSSITVEDISGVPYWFVLAVAALFPTVTVFRRWKSRRLEKEVAQSLRSQGFPHST
ncbi:MAG: hypothetical protein ABGZ17_23210 [Planctomycetaceae bacterium]